MDVNEELKFLGKFKKKKSFFGGRGRGRGRFGGVRVDVNEGGVNWGCQGGCERRIEVFVKIQKKKIGGGGCPGGSVSGGGGASGWM